MANRRANIHGFYRNPSETRSSLVEKAAASAGQYAYRGDQVKFATVVRCDLNGYSNWARGKSIAARAELLDEFFSNVVPRLELAGGIFYRDEGDCVVAIFSEYFQTAYTFGGILNFCKQIVGREYGSDGLSAKAVCSCGELAFFQKAHERGTDDWSSEGEPFVRSARLEQAIASTAQIVFFAPEYETGFAGTGPIASTGEVYHWSIEKENLKIPGLQLPGGWDEIVAFKYIPNGRVQP